jgi:hypothetical protein
MESNQEKDTAPGAPTPSVTQDVPQAVTTPTPVQEATATPAPETAPTLALDDLL